MCNGLTADQRQGSLYELIRGISDETKLYDDTTPQHAAFQWLLNEDPAQVCPEDVISVEQRYILSLLYFSTNGDNWLTCNRAEAPELKPCSFSRYLSADDECLWMGTASANCNADGTLRILSVAENNLNGTLPSEITSLRALERIDLASNFGIRGPIPDGLDNLDKLVSFDLDWNQLSGAIPESLHDAVGLVALDLNNNKLTSSISTSIGKMTNLRILQVDKNRLGGKIPSEIGNASLLNFITADANLLEGEIPEALYTLEGLRALNLHENKLSGPVSTSIGKLTNLEQLSLFDNEFTGPIPSELGLLFKVEHVVLNGTNIEGTMPVQVCDLRTTGNLVNLIVDCHKVQCPEGCCNDCISHERV
jgi:Leucine-rich repeat (LRR) protein